VRPDSCELSSAWSARVMPELLVSLALMT